MRVLTTIVLGTRPNSASRGVAVLFEVTSAWTEGLVGFFRYLEQLVFAEARFSKLTSAAWRPLLVVALENACLHFSQVVFGLFVKLGTAAAPVVEILGASVELVAIVGHRKVRPTSWRCMLQAVLVEYMASHEPRSQRRRWKVTSVSLVHRHRLRVVIRLIVLHAVIVLCDVLSTTVVWMVPSLS